MRQLAIAFAVLATSTFSGGATADAAEKRSPELQVLAHWTGTWDEEVTNKPTEWLPKAGRSSSIVGGTWLGRGFVGVGGTWRRHNPVFISLVNYDSVENVYRLWYSDYAGSMPSGRLLGDWDEKTRTMTWRSTVGARNKVVGKHQFIDKDHSHWTRVITNPAGKVVLDIAGKTTRRTDEIAPRKDEPTIREGETTIRED